MALEPPGSLESRQAVKKQSNKQKKKVAAITYNATLDMNDLKPQDNTTTA